jgi:hypothetical protein
MYKVHNPLNLIGVVDFPGYFNPPNFFPFNMMTHKTNKFADYDSPDRFLESKKRMPKDWHYLNKEIIYNANSNGYRAPEWNTVNWKDSVVIFGCSNATGIGLAEDETVTGQLSQLINRPVINMGVPASSIEFSFYNSVILSEYYPTPYAVIQLWTTLDRCTNFNKNSADRCGIWTPENTYYNEFAKDDYQALMQAKFISIASRNLWKDKCKYYDATFFDRTSYYLECDYIEIDNQARDLTHPGKNNARDMANLISSNIS